MSLAELPLDVLQVIKNRVGLRDALRLAQVTAEEHLPEVETAAREMKKIILEAKLEALEEDFVHEAAKLHNAQKHKAATEACHDVLIRSMIVPTLAVDIDANFARNGESQFMYAESKRMLGLLEHTIQESTTRMDTLEEEYTRTCLDLLRDPLKNKFKALRLQE